MKRRQSVGDREVCNALLIGKGERVFNRDQRIWRCFLAASNAPSKSSGPRTSSD
jgi:hypothetical protein